MVDPLGPRLAWASASYHNTRNFRANTFNGMIMDSASTSDSAHTSTSSMVGGYVFERPSTRAVLSVVIPCFNEQGVIESLVHRLRRLERSLSDRGTVEFVFVDDGSSDTTLEEIRAFSRVLTHVRVLEHQRNQGLAAAMMTGIRAASSELVGVLDADCTYDPSIMESMLTRMSDDVAAITASPYHQQGKVVAVPLWRLRISKAASSLYRLAFRQRLATYTSCCRIYRKSQVENIDLTRPGFVGVTELLWRLDRAGGKILEFPATLSSRVLGHSKLRVLRTVAQHFGFLSMAMLLRARDAVFGTLARS